MAAKVTPITARLGGKERRFGLLTVEDLCDLTEQIGLAESDRLLLDTSALYRWAANPKGCAHVILCAVQKFEPAATLATVNGWGSLMQRVNLAREIMAKSCVSGEEEVGDAPARPTADPGGTGGETPP